MVAPPPSPILVRYHAGAADRPKHLRLREAIIGALESGELPLGTKMAGERELSTSLGLSLGTTQKALGRLMDEGFLVRRQGHGTFVGSVRQPIAGSWHFRFLPPEGGPELPVFATLLDRCLVSTQPEWSRVLGHDDNGYVLVRRALDIGGKFRCCSDMVLPATRFGRLLRLAKRRLTDTNLKTLLATEFSAPTLQSDGLCHVAPIQGADAEVVQVPDGTVGLRLGIVTRSFGREPITWQRVMIPPTRYGLKLDFNPPGDNGSA